jgi:hypothetical protein
MTTDELARKIAALLNEDAASTIANVIDEPNVVGVQTDTGLMFVTVEYV